jgi:hypothetical protein
LRREVLKQSQRTIDAAYEQVRIGAHANALEILQEWLKSRGNSPEDYRWLCERVATWPDSRHAARIYIEYVGRLLQLQRNGEALDLVAQRLRLDPGFRPETAAATLRIAQIAARGGAPRIARALLADFADRYAGDPCIGAAQALAQHLGNGEP